MSEFEDISIDLDESAMQIALKLHVHSMQPASQSLFYEIVNQTGDYKEAIYRAVINESIITAIKVIVDKTKNQ